MSKKYQNAFFIFGLVVLGIMLTQLNFTEVWQGLKHAGYWFFAVVILWAFLYIFNTTSWYLIIKGVCSQSANDENQSNLHRSKTMLMFLHNLDILSTWISHLSMGMENKEI